MERREEEQRQALPSYGRAEDKSKGASRQFSNRLALRNAEHLTMTVKAGRGPLR